MPRVRARNPIGRRPGVWPHLDDELVNGVDLSRYHNKLALFFAEHAPALLPKLYMSVAAPYRAVGTWMVSTTAFQKVLEWRDSDGVPIALPLADSPSGLGIYGRPLVENPAMAAVGSASVSYAFGDFSRFEVVRLPVRVELSREANVDSASLFQTDQVAIRVIERVDGKLCDASGIAVLTSADS